ncbi:C40 family peptidase [Streptomyces sp. H27-D2]|uniref:C40 family peptidase n=1 Tax=Streptomyces sp. H27-D2 TaxID=3046304 RepID=UPI002DB8523C|nr:C40 family peptidase [Streptomyces sp. H27-D2]MEC4017037.1 C40 family peptidase [Streptomyces sp. H27-D2]
MPQTAQIPSRRKPRRTASTWVLRTGVAGGVLSTLAVTGAASPASAHEAVSETLEMPTVSATLSDTAEQSADATQQAALTYELRAQQDSAADQAQASAKKAKQEAERKAEAERKSAAAKKAKEAKEAKAEEARERASRSSERTSLSSASAPASAGSSASSSATGSAASIISFLEAQVGKPYVMGATGSAAYDCSGLTQAAFRTAGIDLPRVSQDQSSTGTQVSLDSLQPGDLLFWGGVGSAYHVAVYVGGGQYIDAANPSKGVVKQSLSDWPPTSATRVL